jgi:hypothetical protein
MVLELLEKEYSVYQFNVDHQIDYNTNNNDFISITKTKDEISVVAITGLFEHFAKREDNWKMLKINGILDFTLTGIISKITAILADNGISVFVISTYNTDYIMVKKDKLEDTIKVLEQNSYRVAR